MPIAPARSTPTCQPLRQRTGTTVIELLIALIIVAVGLLALSGTAALVARETAAGRRELALAWAARGRLERLTSAPCAALAEGTALASGITERWTVTPGPHGTRRITVVVEQAAPGGRAPTVRELEGVVACTEST